MLKSLLIKNYAIIDSIEVEFESGLNILTGETGAGKSIIVDALGLLLGERASTDVVRKEAEKAVVEGILRVAGNRNARAVLEAHDIEWLDDLIIRREISAKGQNRCFLNDTPVTLSVLKTVGDFLVDLHGQHEHQSLLRTEIHLDLLDDFGGLAGLRSEYQGTFRRLSDLCAQLEELEERGEQLKEKKELFEFQLREINAMDPQPGEEESLQTEFTILENSEKLFEATSRLHEMLYDGEQAIHGQLVLARNQLEDLARIDKTFDDVMKECASAAAIVSEMTKFIQSYNSKIEFNPERLEQIRDRMGGLSMLKKKYGGSVDRILEHRDRISKEVALAENFDEEISRLKEAIDAARKVCSHAAQRLSSKRRELVSGLSASVEGELRKLGIANAKFDVSILNQSIERRDGNAGTSSAYVKLGKEQIAATARGIDIVEFLISTNLGEDPKPLAKIASGGEISRIMLALKTILAKSERLPLLIFDEIDVGVSGRIAQAVGKSLKNLSKFHQVISITHLPQIAGLADAHYVVEKRERKGRTAATLSKLSVDERVTEVAKLMSGAEVTDAGVKGAKELMGL
ncbi:MAG: DNA repair protein RecN [Ignavibacteria bacterium]|nr:DNA repair protein RecN [Ignavibacteria bacterium]